MANINCTCGHLNSEKRAALTESCDGGARAWRAAARSPEARRYWPRALGAGRWQATGTRQARHPLDCGAGVGTGSGCWPALVQRTGGPEPRADPAPALRPTGELGFTDPRGPAVGRGRHPVPPGPAECVLCLKFQKPGWNDSGFYSHGY